MLSDHIPRLNLVLPASLVALALACGGEAEPTAAQVEAPAAPAAQSDREALHGAPPGVVLPKLIGPKQYDGPPPMLIDLSKSYTATVEMERGSKFEIELFADKAPKTVNNFVFLAREGFYDGLTVHHMDRAQKAVMGDPTGTGRGSPGYFIEDEFTPDLRHTAAGVVSMDNDRVTDTNGSRFFITILGGIGAGTGMIGVGGRSPLGYLDGLNRDGSPKDCDSPEVSCHTVFGEVTKGLNVIKLFMPRDPDKATEPGDAIKTISIEQSE